jgi:hypothetical protein
MKKNLWKVAALSVMMMFSAQSQAQSLGDVLNAIGSQQGSDIAQGLTSIFSSDKQATAEKLIGTWNYTEPAIVFTSDNILAKAASKIAANKVESKLQEQLSKYGIKPGSFSMTFNEDGTFTETLKGKTTKGTWQVKDSKLILSVVGIQALSITTQIDGKDLQFVTDATKLLNLFKTIGAKSSNQNIKTIASLMKSVKGMQAGITLKKQ